MITYKTKRHHNPHQNFQKTYHEISCKDLFTLVPHFQSVPPDFFGVCKTVFSTNEEIDALVSFISVIQPKSFMLTGVKIGCDCGKIHMLHTHPSTLTVYQNNGCRHKITKEHFDTIFSSSKDVELSRLGLSFRYECELERLQSLATNTTLKSLDLSGNRINIDGYNFLMKTLDENTTLETLTLRHSLRLYKYEYPIAYPDYCRLPDCFILPKNIACLDLTGCDIIQMMDNERSYIVDLISNPALVSFTQDSLKMDDQRGIIEMGMILQALSINETLESFKMCQAIFRIANLSKVLKNNKTLHTLHLGYSRKYGPNTISRFSNAATINTTITNLWLMERPRCIGNMITNLNAKNCSLYSYLIRHCSQFNFEDSSPKRQLTHEGSNPKRQRKQ